MMFGLIVFLASVNPATAGDEGRRYSDPAIDSLLTAGIELTLRQEYDRAQHVFKRIADRFPDNPAGYLYQAALLQSKALDYEELVPEGRFDSLLATAAEKSEQLIARQPELPWGYFFLGTALGNEAFALSERGDWFGAVTRGMSSVTNFEKAVELDSLMVDAYTGIGTYFYWKSRKIEFLTWLPFIGDRRERGIELLHRCAEDGIYNRFASMSALVSIYIDAAEYEKAADVAEEALADVPRNRIFLWGLATSLERGNRVQEALGAYRRLLNSIAEDPHPNYYNELVCRLNLLMLAMKSGGAGNISEELSTIRRLAAWDFPGHLDDRVEDKREKIRQLEHRLTEDGSR